MVERLIRRLRTVAAKQAAAPIDAARRRRATARLRALPDGAQLHLGCGPNKFKGWVNIDIDRWRRPDLLHDLKLGLPARPRSVGRIYSEHVFEHLSLAAGERLMQDCARSLALDGTMRVAMPDLALLVKHYGDDWQDQAWLRDPAYEHISTPAEMLNVALRDWGHHYVYDFDDLERRLRAAGFTGIRRCGWGRSDDPALCGLETRPDSLLIVEATVG